MKLLRFIARNSAFALISVLVTFLIICGCLYFYMSFKLPSAEALKDVRLQVPMRIYTQDGQLIAEFGSKRRIPITLDQTPKALIQALLDTEDSRFYEHPGVDFIGLVRAAKALITTGKKTQGASTITMQVARNFFLTPKKTFDRKINEILLALKINSALSKDKILELYLNKIYLGQGAYGVEAAAEIYYGKKLSQLNLPQLAMIAGLPQAPSRDNPITNPVGAKVRRDHVLERMHELGDIDQKTYEEGIKAPVTASYHGLRIQVDAPYAAAMIRDRLVDEYGNEVVNAGLKVYSTIDSKLQKEANNALIDGLLAYDVRHGYRRPALNLGEPEPGYKANWEDKLSDLPTVNGMQAGGVIDITTQTITVLLADGKRVTIPWKGLGWARRLYSSGKLGPLPTQASDIVSIGSVVRVLQLPDKSWVLTQIPDVQGALVSMNPKNGAIKALVGGFSFQLSHFNRVTQAKRQPGSSFKPFVYAAALAKGFTLASIINDAPIVVADNGEDAYWRPLNNSRQFYGPTRLKVGLVKSRNLVSIRLLRRIGTDYAINYIQRFGFNASELPDALSLALGTAAVNPLQMTRAYAVFANGGYRVTPYAINYIESSEGQLLRTTHPETVDLSQKHAIVNNVISKKPENTAPPIINADVAYLMNHALQDVIKEGTGRAALSLKRQDLAGKTGTTNQQYDAWFAGYNGDLVTTVWIGFDKPSSLHEYGAQAALPIWVQFMKKALAGKPETYLPQPPDIINVRINPQTGNLARPDQSNAIFEMFRDRYAPKNYDAVTTVQQSDEDVYDDTDNGSATIF